MGINKKTDKLVESVGGVVLSGGAKVLLREPTDHFGGYAWTFPKTAPQSGESPRDSAARAVREKTGYESMPRMSLPGQYAGLTSSTCYYVMEAAHPPSKPNWQTSSVRWASFYEARELIKQSMFAAGRDRDLAVLDQVIRYGPHLNNEAPLRTHPGDYWGPLGSIGIQRTVLHPNLRFSADEMSRIKRGFFPTDMDQKWFIYATAQRLRMHRSWTGILIYDVGFDIAADGGARVTEVIVNRNREEYGELNDNEDATLFEKLLRAILLRQDVEW